MSAAQSGAHVQHLHPEAEGHGEVDVAARDVLSEPIGHEHHSDQQQERQRQHLHGGVAIDEATDSAGEDHHHDDEFTPLKDKLGASFFEDQDSSEDEGMPDYKIGGYHPVHVGEILLDRYIIIQKLGWGHFSTVWLTKDIKYNNYVAMKVQKSAQHYLEAAYDEVEILD